MFSLRGKYLPEATIYGLSGGIPTIIMNDGLPLASYLYKYQRERTSFTASTLLNRENVPKPWGGRTLRHRSEYLLFGDRQSWARGPCLIGGSCGRSQIWRALRDH